MSNGKHDDPEDELVAFYRYTESVMREKFEEWMVMADDAFFAGSPDWSLRCEAIAMNSLEISNVARAEADMLLWDWD